MERIFKSRYGASLYEDSKGKLFSENPTQVLKALNEDAQSDDFLAKVLSKTLLQNIMDKGGITKISATLFIFTSSAPEDGKVTLFIGTRSLERAWTIAFRKFEEYHYEGTPILL